MSLNYSRCIYILALINIANAQSDYYADYVSVAGGYYSTVNGSSSNVFDLGYSMFDQGNMMSAEIHFKNITVDIFNVKNVRLSTATVSLTYGIVYSYGDIHPYIAGGMILGMNGLKEEEITRSRPEIIIKKSFSQSFGLTGLVGLQYSLSKQVALYSDIRYSAEYFYAYLENSSDEVINIGGSYARIGIRMTINSNDD